MTKEIISPGTLPFRAIAAFLFGIFYFTFISQAALAAQESVPEPTVPAALIGDLDEVKELLVEQGVITDEGTLTEYGESVAAACAAPPDAPPCVLSADGTWECWSEVLTLAGHLLVCVITTAIPFMKAVKAAKKAGEALKKAIRAAKKKKKAGFADEAIRQSAISAAWSAITAVIATVFCGEVASALNDLFECLWGDEDDDDGGDEGHHDT